MTQTNYISFPGIENPIHGVATNTIGARPDVAVVYAQLQTGSPETNGLSTFEFSFDGSTVTWINCLCDRGTKQITTHGHMQVFEILDRRWSWKRAYWTRAYNVRQSDGSIDTATQATIAQITTALFSSFGETVDVSAITSTEYPELVYDRDNAVDAIEELLTSRGYVISPLMDSSNTTIYVRGVGSAIPDNGDVVSANMTTNPPEIPMYLTCVCGKTLVQSKLKCVPVGIDTDGSIKPVASLAYAPAGGWDGTDLDSMNMISDSSDKEKALLSVGRWYQVSSQADDSFDINFGGTNYCPGHIVVTSAWQYLPIRPVLLDSHDDVFGKKKFDTPFVEGVIYQDLAQPPKQENSLPFSVQYDRRISVDPELGIVKFSDGVAKKLDLTTGKMTFADVYLNCAYAVHDLSSFVKDRYYKYNTLGGIGEDLFKREELNRQIILSYTSGTSTVSAIADNASALDTEVDKFLNAAAYKYQTQDGLVAIYRGIYPATTDGVNLQIRWDIAAETTIPFATFITQYSEGLPQLPTQGERAVIRRANMADDPTQSRAARYRREMRGQQ